MPLDPNSLNVLGKVKLGTPARFVLLTNGIKVVDLVVYRLGTLDSAKRLAKEDGQGKLSFGVVDGEGANLSFKLAVADGFNKAPTNNLLLKGFLNANDFDCKPKIEIVDTLPDVQMDDAVPQVPPQSQAPRTSLPPSRTPPQPPSGTSPPSRTPPQPPKGRPTYRSQGDWEGILAQISSATDAQARTQLLTKTANELKQEKEQVENDVRLMSDPNLKIQQQSVHAMVAVELKALSIRPLAQSQGSQPPQRVPPQPPQPTRPSAPQPPDDRRVLSQDALARAARINAIPQAPYSVDDLKRMLKETDTDAEGDFRKVCDKLVLRFGTSEGAGDDYAQVRARLTDGRRLAEKYIKDHKDPLVGKLPTRVLKRREYCQEFLKKFDALEAQLTEANDAANTFAQTYTRLLDAGRDVPYAVVTQIEQMQNNSLLSPETQATLKALANRIADANRPVGHRLLSEKQHTDLEKAELMLGYGCFKRPDSGTSDVKLLKNQDGSVAFAFKSAKGEGPSSKSILQLPPGSCSMREDVCSLLSDQILSQTGLDLGFPKSQVVTVNGTTGALIEGIKGKMYDRDEMTRLRETGTQQEINDAQKNLDELPQQVTPESLQNVVLFSVMTCQWDSKWDNMMVEPGGNARPLDGGLGFPSQAIIDDLASWSSRELSLGLLVRDPNDDSRKKILPQAQQPMDPKTVQALLKVDVKALLAAAKQRRDKMVQDFPELKDDDHPTGFLDNKSLDFVQASIQATQEILRKQPGITLEQFVTAYQAWFKTWVQTVKSS